MSAPFVTTLRAAPETISLGEGTGERWTIRAQVAEMWDAVRIEAPSATSIRDIKRAAVEALAPRENPDDAVIKLNGWEVLDENVPLSQSGARAGSTFLIHVRRRRPVR